MLVRNLMRKAIVIDKDISLSRAAEVMSSRTISNLICMEKSKVIGVVTEQDLIRNFGKNKKVSKVVSNNVKCFACNR
jgi:predicted transcriptional regulator